MECLTIQLKGSVNDPSLMKMDEIRVAVNATAVTRISIDKANGTLSNGGQLRIVGDASCHFTDSTGSSDLGQVANYSTSSVSNNFYVTAGEYTLFIGRKNDIQYILFPSRSNVTGGSFKYSEKLKFFVGYYMSSDMKVAVTELLNLDVLQEFYCSYAEIYGSLSEFTNLNNMTKFVVEQCCVGGNVSAFADTTKFTEIKATKNSKGYDNLEGSITAFAKNKGLTELNLGNQSGVTGAVEDLLDGLHANGKVSGNILLRLRGSGVTKNGAAITTTDVTATFTSSGWSFT